MDLPLVSFLGLPLSHQFSSENGKLAFSSVKPTEELPPVVQENFGVFDGVTLLNLSVEAVQRAC